MVLRLRIAVPRGPRPLAGWQSVAELFPAVRRQTQVSDQRKKLSVPVLTELLLRDVRVTSDVNRMVFHCRIESVHILEY